jgi:hypothetical protein
MTTETEPPSSEQILHLKADLIERWQQLPVEHQASLAVVLFDSVLKSEYSLWFVEAMALKIEQVARGWHDENQSTPRL